VRIVVVSRAVDHPPTTDKEDQGERWRRRALPGERRSARSYPAPICSPKECSQRVALRAASSIADDDDQDDTANGTRKVIRNFQRRSGLCE